MEICAMNIASQCFFPAIISAMALMNGNSYAGAASQPIRCYNNCLTSHLNKYACRHNADNNNCISQCIARCMEPFALAHDVMPKASPGSGLILRCHSA